jgi:hypothetical protein
VKNMVYQYGMNAVEDDSQWDTISLQRLIDGQSL